MRRVYFAVPVLLATMAACDKPTEPLAPTPESRSFDDCSTQLIADPDCAEQVHDEPVSGVESWSVGGDLSADYGTSYDGEEYVYWCPSLVNKSQFSWRGHPFFIEGIHQKMWDLPSTSGTSLPKAQYRLPPGPHESIDGEATIWSGTIKSTCYFNKVFGSLSVGFMMTWSFSGDAQERGSPGSGDEFEGVIRFAGGTVMQNHAGTWQFDTGDSEVDGVLESLFNEFECSDGWLVFIDGEQICDGT